MPEKNPNYNPEIDKLTLCELSVSLKQKILEAYNHIFDNVRHITAQERENWNLILDYPVATQVKKGMMSPTDKIKLDGIEEHANNYIHPTFPKLGENGGNFLVVDVNKYGHVTAGYNPTYLDLTVSNSNKLDGLTSAEYAKTTDAILMGTVNIPTPTENAQETEAVNIKYYLNNLHPYIKSIEKPDFSKPYLKNLFWIGPKNVLSVYESNKKWNSVYSEASYFQLALNEKIDVNTKPDDYSSFFKFYGKKKLSALNLNKFFLSRYIKKDNITEDDINKSEITATVFGMKADDTSISYEFIFIENDIYLRSGKTEWDNIVLLKTLNAGQESTTTPQPTGSPTDKKQSVYDIKIEKSDTSDEYFLSVKTLTGKTIKLTCKGVENNNND